MVNNLEKLKDTNIELYYLVRDNLDVYNQVNVEPDEFIKGVEYSVNRLRGNDVYTAYRRVFGNVDDLKRKAGNYELRKYVKLLMQNMIIPTYMLYQHHRAVAFDTLLDVTQNSKSDIARVDSATTILKYTTIPETIRVQMEQNININNNNTNVIEELKNTMLKLANNMKDNEVGKILEAKIIE